MYQSPQHVPHPNNFPAPPLPTHQPTPTHSHRSPAAKEPFIAQGIPAVYVSDAGIKYGDAHSSSTRSFTPIKAVGDGSFGTVWLCDWHGALPPNTPLSAMQSGAGARPDYANKRLVAVKRMKKKWEGGWDECRRLKELEALRAIPMHPNIIPLYDSFLLPESKELYFVFEPMEGHLFQLIKARKGRPLAGGLVAAIFRQIVHGLHHIHLSGYFHRDMKPENVLVTTTGLHDYPNLSPLAPPDAPPEKDVVVIIKLADFGLARETRSKPPYTEYVSTRWYRAPEVLLKSKDYSNPVDMWALGTIMAELVNLRPLFPGKVELDQIIKITEVLGDPSDEYGVDARGKAVGGGKWSKGIKMAKNVGFAFPKMQPRDFASLFDRNIPPRLIECIADLLKYDPAARLTSRQCVEHPYLLETSARVNPPHAPLTISTAAPLLAAHRNGVSTSGSSLAAQSPRILPPSHSHSPLPSHHHLHLNHIPDVSASHRQAFYSPSPGPSTTSEYASDPQYAHVHRLSDQMHPHHHFPPQLQHSNTVSTVSSYDASPQTQSEWESMVISPHSEIHEEYLPMDIQTSPMAQEYPSRPPIEPDPMQETTNAAAHEAAQAGTKLGKLTSLGFRRQHKWGAFFGHGDKHAPQQQAHVQNGLPPVDEMQVTSSSSTPSLKRTQSSSTDSRSLPEVSPPAMQPQQPSVQQQQHAPPMITDPKKMRKEAERLQREAEMQRRAQAKKSHREQARAVMEKRNHVLMQAGAPEIEWKWTTSASLLAQQEQTTRSHEAPTGKQRAVAGAGPVRQQTQSPAAPAPYDRWRDERMAKARRREFDDDHSMSSSDVQSLGPISAISFATVDSDPGPSRLVPQRSFLGLNRVSSTTSSLRQFDDFPVSARSSNSLSMEQQLVNDFHMHASVDAQSLSEAGSPPPMKSLSLSPAHSWQTVHPRTSESPDVAMRPSGPRVAVPLPSLNPQMPYGGQVHGMSPSPGVDAPKSAINPIFKVPSLPSMRGQPHDRGPTPSLPPFSELDAISKGEYPPLSPMSFTAPEEES